MIFERAKFCVDIEKLRAEFDIIRKTLSPQMVSAGYGGWSVTSSTGSHLDGWLKSGVRFEEVSGKMTAEDYTKFVREAGQARPVLEYVVPTDACKPYLASIIETLRDAGMNPCRMRLAILKPGEATHWHQDAPDWLYSVRVHIPIETNEESIFETRTEATNLAADGSVYFIAVNRQHRVINRGTSDRIHLIGNVFDTKQFTDFHRYESSTGAQIELAPAKSDTSGD